MSKPKVQIGEEYGMLKVLKQVENPNNGRYKSWRPKVWFRCRCTCGKEVDVPERALITNAVRSCGHLRAAMATDRNQRIKKIGHVFTYEGKTMNLSDWSRETGIAYSTIKSRYNKGLAPKMILKEYINGRD